MQKENLKVEEEKLLDIVTFSQRDIRKLLGNIQFLMLGQTKSQSLELITNSTDLSTNIPEENGNLSGLDKKIEEAYFNLFFKS